MISQHRTALFADIELKDSLTMMLDRYPGNHSIRILLIKKDDVDAEKISGLLRKTLLNLHIMESTSAAHAQGLLMQYQFDCAIIDYQLNDARSSKLIHHILNHKEIPTPVIMISGNSDERIVADAMRDGLFDYLPKRNLNVDLLRQTLRASQAWAEEEFRAKEDRLRFNQLAEGLPQLTWTCLPNGRCDFLNRRWCEYTGVSADEQLGFGWLNQVHPDDRRNLTKAWAQANKSGNEMFVVFRIRRHDGEYRWFDTRAIPQRNESGEIIRWLGSNTDITEVELARQALTQSEQLFQAAFDYAPLGMILVDLEGNIIKANTAVSQLLGYGDSLYEENGESLPTSLDRFIGSQDLENTKFQLTKLRAESARAAQFETQLITRDGRFIPTLTSAAFINRFKEEACYLLQIYDLSERKRHESELIRLAHYDTLTGLGNRAKLYQEIDFLIKKSHRSAAPFALLFGDVDYFKQVNDSLGHEAGDQLLKVIARRLQKCLRHEDSVCRLGGDEFVILLQDVTKFEAVVAVAEKLIKKIKKPIRLGSNRVHVGMTFGIALHPTDGNDAKSLLGNADSALYDAKAKGRGTYQLYRKELTEYVQNRLLLDTELRQGIVRKQFELFYQPIINLHTNEIMGAEALIRWQHPTHGTLMPDDFITYAQESGLIVALGGWVIDEACRHAVEWGKAGFPIGVAVNISPRQFLQQTLAAIVQNALQASGLDASRFIIEVTEQLFLENTELNLRQINSLKALGVNISLDDFGTSYSSLNHLFRFAPQFLKIDRSLISRIDSAPEHNELIKAIIGLRSIVPMQIVAEGIEEPRQQSLLCSKGCELGQGFLFSHPLPQHQFLEFLQKQRAKQPIKHRVM